MYDDFWMDRFVWLDGSIVTYTNFESTQPSSIHQRYMQLSAGMKWKDVKAGNLLHYICKKPSGKICCLNTHVSAAILSSKSYLHYTPVDLNNHGIPLQNLF